MNNPIVSTGFPQIERGRVRFAAFADFRDGTVGLRRPDGRIDPYGEKLYNETVEELEKS